MIRTIYEFDSIVCEQAILILTWSYAEEDLLGWKRLVGLMNRLVAWSWIIWTWLNKASSMG